MGRSAPRRGSVSVAAIDLGASSGRVMLGAVGPKHLTLQAVSRFANDPVRRSDGLHWDIDELYRQALGGLRAAVAASGPDGLASVAVDSWAVDYALVRDGKLLGLPYHYRDERRAIGAETVHQVIAAPELYQRNGLQFLPFNTLYQLAADPMAASADHALLVPDLIGYWLTGRMVTERTNASTTGLLDVHTRTWDTDLIGMLGLGADLFPPLVDAGIDIGQVLGPVGEQVGAPDLRLVTVGSHDTASAVVGVPMSGDDAAYISCGTWGLVGVELESPIVSPESRSANFTNEGGVDGRTRFLQNVMGTWLLSESVRAWNADGQAVSLPHLLEQASSVTGEVPIFDVQDARFLSPGDMPARIAAWCAEHDVAAPASRPAMLRSIIESMAAAFTSAIDGAEALTGRSIHRVHVVGGGSQNRLLCQAIADRSGRVVIAGPVEATALGNVLVQGRCAGAVTGSLDALRALVRETHDLQSYEPGRAATRTVTR